MFGDYLPCAQIIVLPNAGNRVIIPKGMFVDGSASDNSAELKMIMRRWRLFTCGKTVNAKMDRNTVSAVRSILEKREKDMLMEVTKRELENAKKQQMNLIEESIKQINNNVGAIMARFNHV